MTMPYCYYLLLPGGALSFSCGLHLSRPSSVGGPCCLVAPNATIQNGKLQWPNNPVKFFVPASAIASLKVFLLA